MSSLPGRQTVSLSGELAIQSRVCRQLERSNVASAPQLIDPSPTSIINILNRILCRTGGPRSFFACCYALFSPDGEFSAAIAGQVSVPDALAKSQQLAATVAQKYHR